MEVVLERFLDDACRRHAQEAVEHYRAILQMLRSPGAHQPDWDEVANLIRPIWYERLIRPRNRPLLLKDIRKSLVGKEATPGSSILEKFRAFPVLPPPDERISACILGVNV